MSEVEMYVLVRRPLLIPGAWLYWTGEGWTVDAEEAVPLTLDYARVMKNALNKRRAVALAEPPSVEISRIEDVGGE